MKLKVFLLVIVLSFETTAQKSDFAHINFQRADRIASSYSKASLQNMPLLVHQLTKGLNTQVEQFRAIHTWVCLNIESDHHFSETTLKKRRQLQNNTVAFSRWNAQVQSKVFKRLVRDKKTICSGYAYVIKALANLADIECEIVDGYARSVRTNTEKIDFPNHSWNVVKLRGKWYFVDATQASGFYNLDENKYVKNYNDGYFLAEPELFVKNHYPLAEKWLLLDDGITLKTFVKAPIIYGNTYKHKVVPVMPNTLVTRINTGETVVFQFNILDKTHLKDVSLVLSSGFKFKKIKPTEANFKDGILEIKHQFNKKGQYDVHAKIGEDIITSYTVKVEKHQKANSRNS